MLPYLLLIFVPAVFMLFRVRSNSKCAIGNHDLPPNCSTRQNNSLVLPVFFFIFFLVLCFRDITIGYDLVNYRTHFKTISFLSFDQALAREGDKLYYLLNWIVSRFTDDFRVLLVVVAAVTVIPVAKLYNEDQDYGLLKTTMFLVMPTFMMAFSGLRQAIAFSIGVVAYKFVREKKVIPFILAALIAIGFHHSAFVVFLLYPLYHIAFKKKHLWFIVPSIALVFVFNKQIFGFLTRIAVSVFGDDYIAEAGKTDGYTMLILFVLLAVFSYVIPDESKMDKETLGLRNILLMAVLLQCFAPIHTLAMRMNYYFIIFIPHFIPKVIKCRKDSLSQIGYLASWVLTVFFLVYYLDKMVKGCQTGTGSLGIYPYVPYWK